MFQVFYEAAVEDDLEVQNLGLRLIQEDPHADLTSMDANDEMLWARIMALARQHPDCPEPTADMPAALEALRSCCQSTAGPYTRLVMQLEII